MTKPAPCKPSISARACGLSPRCRGRDDDADRQAGILCSSHPAKALWRAMQAPLCEVASARGFEIVASTSRSSQPRSWRNILIRLFQIPARDGRRPARRATPAGRSARKRGGRRAIVRQQEPRPRRDLIRVVPDLATHHGRSIARHRSAPQPDMRGPPNKGHSRRAVKPTVRRAVSRDRRAGEGGVAANMVGVNIWPRAFPP